MTIHRNGEYVVRGNIEFHNLEDKHDRLDSQWEVQLEYGPGTKKYFRELKSYCDQTPTMKGPEVWYHTSRGYHDMPDVQRCAVHVEDTLDRAYEVVGVGENEKEALEHASFTMIVFPLGRFHYRQGHRKEHLRIFKPFTDRLAREGHRLFSNSRNRSKCEDEEAYSSVPVEIARSKAHHQNCTIQPVLALPSEISRQHKSHPPDFGHERNASIGTI